MTLPDFPVDPETLDLLSIALDPGPDAGRTSVSDFLDLMSFMGGSDPDAVAEVLEEADPYDSGRHGADIVMMRDPLYHEHDVIRALIAEVRRLRGETA
jgi:hypothetical protein